MRVEKTVFISYRRTNAAWALAVYQYLSRNGYDVFFDFTSINNGDFEQIILGNIKSRAHFLVILTPSALERVNEPNDWLRREIETALDEKRNIVPLMLEGFDYASPSIAKYLTGKLATLPKYNAVRVPIDYFEEAMARICNNYLNTPLEMVLHPASPKAQAAAVEEKKAANKEVTVTGKTLSSSEWFEKGNKQLEAGEYRDAISSFTEAIRLKPDYAEAYHSRGVSYELLQNYDDAFQDYSTVVRLKPDLAEAYHGIAIYYYSKQDMSQAIKYYDDAIRFKPHYPSAFLNRGNARYGKRDLEGAIQDYNEAIRLKPDDASAYNNRGNARRDNKDARTAINDYTEAIRLKPDYAEAYYGRGTAYWDLADWHKVVSDWEAALRIDPHHKLANEWIGRARDKLK